ncbi:MAG: hypothetical protein A3F54_04930 [Candidatus Kerfeldbacteria bacterium RIFCSPHIGHO2_12_FULL_48_17]|uniref:ECF transporter S component n=1 Tax=Candidatus Kerfeldbacteria bacterium RIFCSPHIGHO2_12_FULL_48_17 TaxID=1798542 RepID=A0A1G2B4Y2_9BACT|nr:MAG: hypothetical protein A3F54_04930 [Candidatus Kerfeldbacteria bacterium RIFCSPHIGHO2_12_FULL_48_17]
MSFSWREQAPRIAAAGFLIAIGLVGRWALYGISNVETIMVVSLLAGVLLGGMYAVIVPLAVVAVSDVVIGNESILLYTWSAWLLVGLFGWVLRRFTGLAQARHWLFALGMGGSGIVGTVFFYLWTNFGVWQLYDYYAPTWQGLMASYVAGLPFLLYQLAGNIVIVPVISLAFVLMWRHAPLFAAARRKSLSTISLLSRKIEISSERNED